MNPLRVAAPLALICLIAAGCGGESGDNAGDTPQFATSVEPTAPTATTGAEAPADPTKAPPPPPPKPASGWPSPEDCTTHNPATVTKHYEAGIHVIKDGSHVLMRFEGGPEDIVGTQALALAQRFRKHCFIGRDNNREDRNQYIFDYWRDASGMKPAIPDLDEICSDYDRGNLTVEDMGGGHGWRVKDHDHVLHLFDNESDARKGEQVLSKYSRICTIGQGDEDQDFITFFL